MYRYIYLFRHGQTTYNKKGIFTGWKDPKLTPEGKKDARRIAASLRKRRIDVAVHTRLRRSRDTLAEVLKSHPECKTIRLDDRMIERNYGKLSGKKHEAMIDRFGSDIYAAILHWHHLHALDNLRGKDRAQFLKKVGTAEYDVIHRSFSHAPPGGESVQMVQKRVLSFIRWLLAYMKKHKVNVAISAHGNSMRPFRKYFEKLTTEEMMRLENPHDKAFTYRVKV